MFCHFSLCGKGYGELLAASRGRHRSGHVSRLDFRNLIYFDQVGQFSVLFFSMACTLQIALVSVKGKLTLLR